MQLPGWRKEQVDKAVASLLKYIGEQQQNTNQLIEDDELLYLLVALKKTPQGSKKDKPIRVPIPHPLYSTEGADICLFVKDHKGEGQKAAKARLSKFVKTGGVNKVMGISKLRTKYESHEAKRQLCNLYDVFLADDRILPSLPKLIGKSFFKRKKQPIPVDIRAANFPEHVKRAVESTYMHPPTGSCLTVRVARSSHGTKAIAENVNAALEGVVAHIPKKWSNVQAVYLKTSQSVALPLYQTLPDQPVKIVGQTE
eukprot:jgi/Chrzof1/757/Cz01g27160.t1